MPSVTYDTIYDVPIYAVWRALTTPTSCHVANLPYEAVWHWQQIHHISNGQFWRGVWLPRNASYATIFRAKLSAAFTITVSAVCPSVCLLHSWSTAFHALTVQHIAIHSTAYDRGVFLSAHLHVQASSCYRHLSVRLSVCQTRVLWQNEIIVCRSFNTIRRSNASSFLRPNFVILSSGVHPERVC